MTDNKQRSADEQAVAELIKNVFSAYQKFDPSLVDQCDLPDCTLWDLFEPQLVRGGRAARAEFRKKDMTDSASRGELTINLEEPVIDVWGDFAVARYYLDYAFAPPGAMEGRVRVTTVARRVDGQWRRVHHHEGVVPTGRPAMKDA